MYDGLLVEVRLIVAVEKKWN